MREGLALLACVLGTSLAAACNNNGGSAPGLGDNSGGPPNRDAGSVIYDSGPGDDGGTNDATTDTGGGSMDSGVDAIEGSFACMTTYDAGSAACNTCIIGSCCGTLETCQGSTACSAALQCFEACGTDGGAFDACLNSCSPSGPDSIDYVEFVACAQSQCGAGCGLPTDGGTGIFDASADGGPHP